jgi:hypothetical protein
MITIPCFAEAGIDNKFPDVTFLSCWWRFVTGQCTKASHEGRIFTLNTLYLNISKEMMLKNYSELKEFSDRIHFSQQVVRAFE